MGNILGLKNLVDVPSANTYGGPAYQRFTYDSLYRLTKAEGVFPYNHSGPNPDASSCAAGPGVQCRVYGLDLTYDSIHNITQKTQADTRYPAGGSAIPQKKTTYDWTYTYNASGPTSTRPHAPTHIGSRTYTYDANGNQLGWTHDQNGTRRLINWDEENRIQSIEDNGHEKAYKYDDQGQRTIKRGPQGETVYVNQFFTQRPGATGTKHVYAGTSRIASKLLRQDVPGANPAGKTFYEKDLYFYHPDHLGSSSYVTDLNGKLYEHLQYFPFGEAWVEENTNAQRTPYHFTAKELDEETGLYYFGARYYDPRTSVWQSADSILGKYLPAVDQESDQLGGRGGVYNSLTLSLYSYAHLNPLMLVDPDGRDVAVPMYFRMNTSTDISAHRGSYGAVGFRTYDYSTPQQYEAAKAAGTLSKPIGGFEVSFDAFSSKMADPERGKMLGDKEKWAQVNDISAWSPDIHAISVTDIGKKNQDKLTVTRGGKNTTISAGRIHYGGPFFSEGCATCVSSKFAGGNGNDAKAKTGFESLLKDVLPSLKSGGKEGTYIQLPAREWWPYYTSDK